MNGYTGWIAWSVAGALLGTPLSPPRADAQRPAEGKRLFETICVACHTIGAGVRIGPDLQGVTERRTADWLRRFIRDPEQLRKAGDSIAMSNRAKFNLAMPTLGLSEQQVESVIAHLSAAAPAPVVRPTLYLPTLALAALAALGVTLLALSFGTKRTEIRT